MQLLNTFKILPIAASLAFGLATNAQAQSDNEWQFKFKAGAGTKELDSEWQQYDEQNAVLFGLDVKRDSWPVSFTIDAIGSGEENGTDEVSIGEFHFGARWSADKAFENFVPYIGGGLAFAAAELKEDTTTVERNGSGAWIGVGFDYKITDNFTVGVDTRYSDAEMTYQGVTFNAGGTSCFITLGYTW